MAAMSEVLMLGRLDMFQPSVRMQWLNPKPTTPAVPQNLLRQTMQNGPSALGAVQLVENLGLGNLGKVARMLGALGDDPTATPASTAVTVPADNTPSTTDVQPGKVVVVEHCGTGRMALAIVSTASMAASAYHGYRRNQSVGWALWWGFLGAVFPVITPTIAVAQGFGERRR